MRARGADRTGGVGEGEWLALTIGFVVEVFGKIGTPDPVSVVIIVLNQTFLINPVRTDTVEFEVRPAKLLINVRKARKGIGSVQDFAPRPQILKR